MNSTRHLLFTLAVVMFASSSMYAQKPPLECERLGFLPNTITTEIDHPDSVCAADLDGDGDIDVLSASSADNKIAWYESWVGRTFPDTGKHSVWYRRADPDPHAGEPQQREVYS